MKNSNTFSRFVGLDVHADTIAVAVSEQNGEVHMLGTILNREDSIKKLVKKLGSPNEWKACYEAGPTGYALYWQFVKLGCHCEVIAPTLIPKKAGDRIKTDRKDAEILARCLRAGDLTTVWVPDSQHESLRDLVRLREITKQDQTRARHRLSKFLLRHGLRPTERINTWSSKYLDWIRGKVKLEEAAAQMTLTEYLEEVLHQAQRLERIEKEIDQVIEDAPADLKNLITALQALRGVKKITAVTLVSEIGRFSRFENPRQLMAYGGLVPSEYSSGTKTRRGGITKTGNNHLRRILGEAAWSAGLQPKLSVAIQKRQALVSPEIVEIARKARYRLYARYHRLIKRGKSKHQAVTAVAREMLGFIWAIGVSVESNDRVSSIT